MPEANAFQALADLYIDLNEALAALQVRCAGCGQCCHFDKVDHVLYASWLEVDYFVRAVRQAGLPAQDVPELRCPFQSDQACSAHAMRPLGCRLHFCSNEHGEPLSDDQALQLEMLSTTYHGKLQDLHAKYELEWNYAPFLPTLRTALHSAQ